MFLRSLVTFFQKRAIVVAQYSLKLVALYSYLAPLFIVPISTGLTNKPSLSTRFAVEELIAISDGGAGGRV